MNTVYQQLETTTDIPAVHDVVTQRMELEAAWLWFADTVDSDPARRYCLEQALRANPDSQLARQALARMTRQQAAEPPRPARTWRLGWLLRRWKRAVFASVTGDSGMPAAVE